MWTWVWSVTFAAAAPEPSWEQTIERVAPAVVSLRVTSAHDFDTEQAGTIVGTGFVVDAARGLVLTNRHLVQPGPVTAEATFLDDEVLALKAVYRDPVHDFGFFQFDPAELRHLAPEALTLAPEAARVGTEIRLIGSDGGEKASILGGTLARLDRAAPAYGRGSYNDFNTYYLQAATNTSGGSSGAPVIDAQGRVVALNAGGSLQAASSYYLPLQRVVRALDLLRRGEPVSRGCVQVSFLHAPYSELRRGGLPAEVEAQVRAARPDAGGLLTVQRVLPGGASDGRLLPGDALLSVAGVAITDFVSLDEVLDAHVGRTVTARALRAGQEVQVELQVVDLHAVTPDAFVEIGGGVLHDLSYQQAMAHGVPQRGVFVADPGYAFAAGGVVDRAVLVQLGEHATPNLTALVHALTGLGDGERARARFSLVGEPGQVFERVVTIDRTWFPARRCERDEQSGRWPCGAIAAPPARPPTPPPEVLPPRAAGPRWMKAVAPALVMVEQRVPYPTAGIVGRVFGGAGAVIDRARGLVLTSREAVPVALGDVALTFAGAVRVPAVVVGLHPVHNLAVVQYEPAALGGIEVSELAWSRRGVGGELHLVGLDPSGRALDAEVELGGWDWLTQPVERPPRFREQNLVVHPVNGAPELVGGVVVDRAGGVVALWHSFGWEGRARRMAAMPLAYVSPWVEQLRSPDRATSPVRAFGAELAPLPLVDARERGLPDEVLAAMLRADRQASAHEVMRVSTGSPAAAVLRAGDLVVRVEGRPLTRLDQLEAALQGREALTVELVRDGALSEVRLPLASWATDGVRQVLTWAGLVLHDPHLELFAQRALAPTGVYVSWRWDGSPAGEAGFRAGERIVELDGVPVPSLAAFAERIAALERARYLTLRVEDVDGRPLVRTIGFDPEQWPAQWLDGADGVWTRRALRP